MEQNRTHSARASAAEPASHALSCSTEPPPPDPLDFDPVSVRHRIDGWTPEKQREYVELLADSGVARYAAEQVGMSEQSAARLRRRPDARSFDLACEAAVRMGAKRMRSIAFERAIEGVVKRHYYHGELKSEERVYDNRLLIYLLRKCGDLVAPEAEAAARKWGPLMEAVEQGLPAPPPEPVKEREVSEHELWMDDAGIWWTAFPAPANFAGEERHVEDEGYQRTLSPEELAVIDAATAEEEAEELRFAAGRHDRFFGFEGGLSSSYEAEPSELSEPCRAPRPQAPPSS